MTSAALVLSLLVAQVSPAPAAPAETPEQSAARAAAAAEKAAQAAQSAARSAADAVSLLQKLAEGKAGQLTPPLTPPPVVAPPPPPPAANKGWSGTFDLGLIWLTGNSNTLTFNGAAAFAKKFQSGWVLSFKANATYGQSSPVGGGPSTVAAEAATGQLRVDRLFSDRFSVYLLGGVDTDHIASIELRSYGEAGVGLIWLDHKEDKLQTLLLRTDLGVRYADERQFQYYPTEEALPELPMLSPRIGVTFRYALSKDVIFNEVAEVIPDIFAPNPVLFNSYTDLTAHLVKSLSIAFGFRVTYDSVPPQGKVPTDTALNIGLEYAL